MNLFYTQIENIYFRSYLQNVLLYMHGLITFSKIPILRFGILIIIILFSKLVIAQETKESWSAYIANYEDGKQGTVTLRMDLISFSPIVELPNVVVTGLKYETSRPDGFPDSETFKILHKVGDELLEIISLEYKGLLVGSFTHSNERLEYFYVKSTEGLEERLEQFYKENYPNYKYYIGIKEDPKWEYYRDFLYPTEETLNYMGDQSVILQLKEAGDLLTTERRVDHWLYFASKNDLKEFVSVVKMQGFKIEAITKNKEASLPHQLQIWRTDKVDISTIYPITSELRKLAPDYNGVYDGWETVIVK